MHTGQSLYEVYSNFQLQANSCTVPEWGELDAEDQAAWDAVAFVANGGD